MPVNLHAVAEGHPELGLLLRGHTLPALLNAGESGVGDSMVGSKASLHSVQGGNGSSADGGLAARDGASERAKKHCAEGGRWQHHVENGSMGIGSDIPGSGESGTAGDSTGEVSGGVVWVGRRTEVVLVV